MAKKSSRFGGSISAAGKMRSPGKLTGQPIHGKYRLGNLIGTNRAGSLYEAKSLPGGDALAVLALAPGTNVILPLNVDSDHPNLIRVRDLIEKNGKPQFVVMDEPPGKTLRQLIDKRGRMEPGPAIATAMQLLSALHFLHGKNRTHGALDPTWVFLQQDPNESLRLLLVDVGYLGREEIPPLPFYTAPELVLGEHDTDHRSDIWSLGVILFEMVYGQRPFAGRNKDEICSQILLKDPSFPDTPAKIPDDLVAAMRNMLERDPEDRYQNVTTIIGDLLMLHEEYEETLDDDVARVLRESLVPPPIPPKPKPVAKKSVAELEREDEDLATTLKIDDEDLATTLTMQRSDRSPAQPAKPKPVAKKSVADKKPAVKQDGKKTVIGIPTPIFPVKSLAAEAARKRTTETPPEPAAKASPKPEPKPEPKPAKPRPKTKSRYSHLGAEPVSLDDKTKPTVEPIEDLSADLELLETDLEIDNEELATTLPMKPSDTSPDRRRLMIIAGSAALAILLVVVIVVAASGESDEAEPDGASASEVDEPKPEPEPEAKPEPEPEPEPEPKPEVKPEPEPKPEPPPQPLAEVDEPEPKPKPILKPKTSVETGGVHTAAPVPKWKKKKKKKKKASTGLASNPWGD